MTSDSGRLIVVLSTERSGSTLLTAMLGGNRQVVAPPEMHMLRFPDFDTWTRTKPNALASLSWLMSALDQPADEASLLSRFSGQESVSVYRELLCLCGPTRVLVDKTPAYARRERTLQRIELLQPFYIWLVRHPLGVVRSNMERREQRQRLRQTTVGTRLKRFRLGLRGAYDRLWFRRANVVQEHLAYWTDLHTRIETFLASVPTERQLRVQFEALVRAPASHLERLCEELGLELAPAMLEPNRNVPSALAWGLGDEKVQAHSKIDVRVADRWREHLDERLLPRGTRELMKRIAEA